MGSGWFCLLLICCAAIGLTSAQVLQQDPSMAYNNYNSYNGPAQPQQQQTYVYKARTEIGDPCQTDDECGQNAVCWYYNVSPRCQMGTCTCKAQYLQISTNKIDCYPPKNLTLNAPCVHDELEVYPKGASCVTGKVQCNAQYQPVYWNSTCILLTSVARSDPDTFCTSDAYCNPEIGLFCNLGTQRCDCFASYTWLGNGCTEAYYGTTCETDSNCQTGGAYTLGGPGGGGICSDDHTCKCDRGFQTVNFTQFYLDETHLTTDMIMQTWTICIANRRNTLNLDVDDYCTVPLWSSATPLFGQRYCRPGLACIVCPEYTILNTNASTSTDNTGARTAAAAATTTTRIRGSSTRGTCKNASGRTGLRSNFAVAALLTALYSVAFIAKILTALFGTDFSLFLL